MLFLVVMLFGALSFTVAQMVSTETPQAINDEQDTLQAGEILDLGRTMRQVIQNLKISNRCSENDINFAHGDSSPYTHSPLAPSDCAVFESSQGGLASYPLIAPTWMDSNFDNQSTYGTLVFSGESCVENLPDGDWNGCQSDSTDNEELIMFLPYIRPALCLKINEALGIENPAGQAPLDQDCAWDQPFTGEYLLH